MRGPRLSAYLKLLAVAGIWGAASIVIKLTLEGITPLPFLTYRFLLSALIAVIVLRGSLFSFLKKPSRVLVGILLYSFLSTTFALGFLFLGLDRTTVLNLSLITLTIPLLVEFAGVIFLNEHITKREKTGSLIAFSGTLLTVVEPIMESGAQFGQLEGNILILLYILGDVSSVIILKKMLQKQINPAELTHFSFVVGFITILPVALAVYGTSIVNLIVSLPLPYHAGVWYMALLSGTVAYILRAQAQKTIEVSEAALFAYLNPVISAPLALLVLREHITLPFLFGALVIAAGVYIAETKTRKQL